MEQQLKKEIDQLKSKISYLELYIEQIERKFTNLNQDVRRSKRELGQRITRIELRQER